MSASILLFFFYYVLFVCARMGDGKWKDKRQPAIATPIMWVPGIKSRSLSRLASAEASHQPQHGLLPTELQFDPLQLSLNGTFSELIRHREGKVIAKSPSMSMADSGSHVSSLKPTCVPMNSCIQHCRDRRGLKLSSSSMVCISSGPDLWTLSRLGNHPPESTGVAQMKGEGAAPSTYL